MGRINISTFTRYKMQISLDSWKCPQIHLPAGFEMTPWSTNLILKHGEALMAVLKQNQYNVYQLDKQVFDLFVAKNQFLDDLNKEQIRAKLDEAYNVFKATHQDVLNNINKNKEISDQDAEILLKEMKEFFENLNR